MYEMTTMKVYEMKKTHVGWANIYKLLLQCIEHKDNQLRPLARYRALSHPEVLSSLPRA